MVNVNSKDNGYIVTLVVETKEEQELLDKILNCGKTSQKRQEEYDYWTIGKKKNRQMEISEFIPVDDMECPFDEKVMLDV